MLSWSQPSSSLSQTQKPKIQNPSSKKLHEQGTLVMSGAFLDNPGEALSTMGVLTSREAAEDYIKHDPFMLRGMIAKHTIREWANMFA